MYTQRICRICMQTYITGTNSKGEDHSSRNVLKIETMYSFFPTDQETFDICHECHEDFLKRLKARDRHIRENFDEIDGSVVECDREWYFKNYYLKKELPKNEK